MTMFLWGQKVSRKTCKEDLSSGIKPCNAGRKIDHKFNRGLKK